MVPGPVSVILGNSELEMSLLSRIKGFLGRRRKKATPAADVEKAFSESSIEEDTDDIGVPFVGTGGTY